MKIIKNLYLKFYYFLLCSFKFNLVVVDMFHIITNILFKERIDARSVSQRSFLGGNDRHQRWVVATTD